MLNGLDLFSGIGGISLALSPWVRTVAYCEQDRYCQGVLMSRMQTGELDWAPISTDVCELQKESFGLPIDIISGGFPCQDISVAGNGGGLDGERSGLFFEICRLARDLRPKFIFLENVPAITVRGLDRVLLEFDALGYDARWTTISASSVGANHQRDRWFLLAYARGQSLETMELHNGARSRKSWLGDHFLSEVSKADIVTNPRENDGVQIPVGAVRALGNTVVPQQVRKAFTYLCGLRSSQ